MKHLYLVRHAKSSWDYLELDDFDRPLNKRGMTDAPRMGRYLAGRGVVPAIIVASPARRTHETANAFVHTMNIPPTDFCEDSRIYAATASTLLDVIREWDDACSSVMVVGHNPGIAEVAGTLMGESAGDVPTCTVMGFSLGVTCWSAVVPGCGMLQFKVAPKTIHPDI